LIVVEKTVENSRPKILKEIVALSNIKAKKYCVTCVGVWLKQDALKNVYIEASIFDLKKNDWNQILPLTNFMETFLKFIDVWVAIIPVF
jgi:hypothetical protein